MPLQTMQMPLAKTCSPDVITRLFPDQTKIQIPIFLTKVQVCQAAKKKYEGNQRIFSKLKTYRKRCNRARWKLRTQTWSKTKFSLKTRMIRSFQAKRIQANQRLRRFLLQKLSIWNKRICIEKIQKFANSQKIDHKT